MTSLLKTAAAFAVMISICAAADQKNDDKPAATAPASQPATGPASETAVTVNGKAITEAQVDEMFEAGTRDRPVPAAQVPMLKQRYRSQILNVLIDDQLFEVEAKKENITVSEEEVAKRVESDLDAYARQSNTSREDLAKQVEQRTGMGLKDYIAKRAADPFLQRMLRRAKLVEKRYPEQLKVTEAEIKDHYEQNLESTYKEPAKVRASHILIGARGKNEAEKAEAKKKAEEVLAEVKKEGADFAELAGKHSDCPSKANGGDLNFFPREKAMVEPFAAAAFALKVGEISDVVETEFGYHIIKVTDRREASTTSLEEATAGIREQLHREKVNSEMKKYTEELRKDAKIEYPKGKEPATQPMNLGMVRPPAGRTTAVRPSTQPAVR